MTPEGRIKAQVKRVLDKYKDFVYYEMAVPTGYGKSGLDFTGCANGRFFVIETKAPGKWLTPRQRRRAVDVITARGMAFAVSNEHGLKVVEQWLKSVQPVGSR